MKPISEYPASWLALFNRLVVHKILTWERTVDGEYVPLGDREEVADLQDADVVTSILKDAPVQAKPKAETGTWESLLEAEDEERHIILLDIDVPAYLIPSSTPGHHHLYIVPPGGCTYQQANDVLSAMVAAGVVESGYKGACEARGFTAARLPWVTKDLANEETS